MDVINSIFFIFFYFTRTIETGIQIGLQTQTLTLNGEDQSKHGPVTPEILEPKLKLLTDPV